MALTGAMLELSSVIALYTAPRIVLESALPFQLQTVPERQELTVLGQPFGAMSQIYWTEPKHAEQGTPADCQTAAQFCGRLSFIVRLLSLYPV